MLGRESSKEADEQQICLRCEAWYLQRQGWGGLSLCQRPRQLRLLLPLLLRRFGDGSSCVRGLRREWVQGRSLEWGQAQPPPAAHAAAAQFGYDSLLGRRLHFTWHSQIRKSLLHELPNRLPGRSKAQ